jgi:hypothetical protein
MPIQVIPLNNSPNQTFTVQLNIDGKPLILNVGLRFNSMAGYWLMTLSDINNSLIVDSVPLITGTYPAANILKQQVYKAIGAWYIINVSNLLVETGSDVGYGMGPYGGPPGYGGEQGQGGVDYPDNTNLGTDFQLWVDDTPTV